MDLDTWLYVAIEASGCYYRFVCRSILLRLKIPSCPDLNASIGKPNHRRLTLSKYLEAESAIYECHISHW